MVGVPKKYEEPESCGSAADFLLGVEMERDLPGREEVEVNVLMAVETDLLSNHNDSTKCQSSYPATSAINDDDQVAWLSMMSRRCQRGGRLSEGVRKEVAIESLGTEVKA